MNDIQAVKQAYPCWLEVEKDLGQPLKVLPDKRLFVCPFHVEKTPGAFWVYADGYQCFSCGANGDVFDWYQYFHNLNVNETIKLLTGGNVNELEHKVKQAERAIDEAIKKAEQVKRELKEAKSWLDYHQQLQHNENYRHFWRERGVPDWYQNWYELGFCTDYALWRNDNGNWVDYHHSPSLSIPVWQYSWDLGNVKHRLLIPPEGTDQRYTQEKRNVPATPFVTNPDKTKGKMLITEGEIKSIVTFATLDDPELQVIGLPSKSMKPVIPDSYDPVYILLDPDAYEPDQHGHVAVDKLEESIGKERVRKLWLPDKVDDLITAGALGKADLKRLMKSGRKA